ncbi:MAG TPA: YcaO-like family protein [Acidimicrobiales bacterium]|nr:YcaO-like family protein [Acidimicrobiales bacterium]
MTAALDSSIGTLPPAPIHFLGAEHRAPKGFRDGTHRVCSPEETLERVQPLLAVAGITRIADVTGLDRIGIPTVLAMRPNAPTLANAAGKGFTLAAATVSAVMEGIELHYAEAYDPPEGGDGIGIDVSAAAGYVQAGHGRRLTATLDELAAEGLACTPEHLPFSRHNLFRPDLPEDWVIGFDLIGQQPLAVPFASVSMVPGHRRPNPRLSFQGGSNGLASGNVFLEAVCSGLAEVIERDAVTCTKLRRGGAIESGPAIDLDRFESDNVRALIARLQQAGVRPVVFDCTVDTGVPTYTAFLFDERLPSTGVYRGYGGHLDPEIAIIRALTEAVQGRSIYIAGTRDDLFTLEHRRLRRRGDDRGVDPSTIPLTRDGCLPPSLAAETFEEDCRTLVAAVQAVGLEHVVVVDLAPADLQISVVRVIVPGLEGYSSLVQWTTGPRGRTIVDERVGRQMSEDLP